MLQPEFIHLKGPHDEVIVLLNAIISIHEEDGKAVVCYTDENLDPSHFFTNVPMAEFLKAISPVLITPEARPN